jgi:hypothetical protein
VADPKKPDYYGAALSFQLAKVLREWRDLNRLSERLWDFLAQIKEQERTGLLTEEVAANYREVAQRVLERVQALESSGELPEGDFGRNLDVALSDNKVTRLFRLLEFAEQTLNELQALDPLSAQEKRVLNLVGRYKPLLLSKGQSNSSAGLNFAKDLIEKLNPHVREALFEGLGVAKSTPEAQAAAVAKHHEMGELWKWHLAHMVRNETLIAGRYLEGGQRLEMEMVEVASDPSASPRTGRTGEWDDLPSFVFEAPVGDVRTQIAVAERAQPVRERVAPKEEKGKVRWQEVEREDGGIPEEVVEISLALVDNSPSVRQNLTEAAAEGGVELKRGVDGSSGTLIDTLYAATLAKAFAKIETNKRRKKRSGSPRVTGHHHYGMTFARRVSDDTTEVSSLEELRGLVRKRMDGDETVFPGTHISGAIRHGIRMVMAKTKGFVEEGKRVQSAQITVYTDGRATGWEFDHSKVQAQLQEAREAGVEVSVKLILVGWWREDYAHYDHSFYHFTDIERMIAEAQSAKGSRSPSDRVVKSRLQRGSGVAIEAETLNRDLDALTKGLRPERSETLDLNLDYILSQNRGADGAHAEAASRVLRELVEYLRNLEKGSFYYEDREAIVKRMLLGIAYSEGIDLEQLNKGIRADQSLMNLVEEIRGWAK